MKGQVYTSIISFQTAFITIIKFVGCFLSTLFVFRDHDFDRQERRRTKARRKLGTTTSDLDAPPKGTQPMRRELHKCDESKILPFKKTDIQIFESI